MQACESTAASTVSAPTSHSVCFEELDEKKKDRGGKRKGRFCSALVFSNSAGGLVFFHALNCL